MKENRLIELLDEYDSVQYHKINHKIENWDIYRNVWGTDGWHQVWRYCKKFWFIQWLVKKDKIDNSKFYDKNILKWFMTLTKEEKFDSVIMNLSIQDNPIEFLISILK